MPVWHPDVRVWEVRGADGGKVGLFFGDYFARPSKRSGAWMTSLRDQEKLEGDVRPLIVNVCNFAKAADGEPTLISFDDARTLFHEFGHALHGLLSAVTYPKISGTNVATDFVELPSQLYEHWLEQPEVLRRFAPPLPDRRADAGGAAATADRGAQFQSWDLPPSNTSLAPSSTSIFIRWRRGKTSIPPAFEAAALSRIGMPDEIVMRHRPPHFAHIFSGGGYAAAYYSYMWSEVLDADAFAAFEETGDIFDPATARRLREAIYAAGGAQEPADAYKAFRGRLPSADALLRKRGFATAAAELSVMDLHSAGHRRGVVCAPHTAAVEAGRAILGRGRQCARSHGGDGGGDRGRLSAHEPSRRRRLLAHSRAERPGARHHGGGSGRRWMRSRTLSRL